MEGKTFWAHNGLVLSPIIITNSMLGKRVGEYIQTKARCVYKRKKNKRGRKR
jgi:ribosomal protein S19